MVAAEFGSGRSGAPSAQVERALHFRQDMALRRRFSSDTTRRRGGAAGRISRWVRRLGVGALALLLLLLVWGLIEPYTIDEQRETAFMPGLPSGWEGREIALLADLQVGMWAGNTRTIRGIVRRLVADPPEAVLIAGDFIYDSDGRADELSARAAALLAPLVDAGIPTFAVLGNHDYALDDRGGTPKDETAASVRNALEQAGVRVLHNESAPLVLGATDSLYVVGIGDEWAGEDHATRALRGVPAAAPRVVFMHNPRSFRRLPPGTAPLALAGHTHGGQISLPFTPHWSWMSLVKHHPTEPHGWARDSEDPRGNRLYVNVGIGFSSVPLRINAPPELTRITLRRGQPRRP